MDGVLMSASCYVVVFFFFKQKTAYEMRISDWSSDVCSSDLGRRRRSRSSDNGVPAGNSVRKAALSHPARLQETATMNPHRRHAGHAAPGRPLRGLYLLTPDDDDTARLLERARAVVAHAALLQYRNKEIGRAHV